MRRDLLAALLSICGMTLSGCALAGSTAIRNGRAVYNDAIVTTNNEQLLAMIVRMRYQEPYGLLAVSSVTANVRIQATIGGQAGIGPESTYTGNLVPLSAGALYEESPTISYTPIQGQEYLRQLLSPIPMEFAVLLLSTAGNTPMVATLLIKEINGVQNPAFLTEAPADDGTFTEIAALLASLHRRGALVWSQEAGDPPTFAIVLRGTGPEYARDVTRLHELLGLPKPIRLDAIITMRVQLGIGGREDGSISVRTRSVFELFEIAAGAVDVPAEHLESGLAMQLPPRGPVGAEIRIRRSKDRPKSAMVAVQHHDWWYSIDGTDGKSKRTFQLLESIMSARMADNVGTRAAAPVLTVPVK